MRSRSLSLPLLALASLLAGCASEAPVAYQGLASSSYLAPNSADTTGRMPFRYRTQVNWESYHSVIVDPVTVYEGQDQQFGDLTPEQKEELARYMQETFTAHLAKRFTLVRIPGPGTLRIKLTLTGATQNTPALATLSRIDVAGLVYNGVQAARDGEGAFTGAVRYAVEIYDARSTKLLSAFVAKDYPPPFDLPAGIGALTAAKAGIDRGANALVAQLK